MPPESHGNMPRFIFSRCSPTGGSSDFGGEVDETNGVEDVSTEEHMLLIIYNKTIMANPKLEFFRFVLNHKSGENKTFRQFMLGTGKVYIASER